MLPIFFMIDDEELKSSLEEIYNRYKKEALWIAFKILYDKYEAEDVVHDAIIKLASTIKEKDNYKCNKIRGLFVIIVRQLSINIYNKRKNVSSTPYDETTEDISNYITLDDTIIKLEQAKIITESLEKLNPSYVDILTLKYYYELSNLEISRLLNITEGNVRIRLYRAKQAAKHILLKEVDLFESN